MSEIPHFPSLADVNKWIDTQLPPGTTDDQVFNTSLCCEEFGAPLRMWAAMTPSQRTGWIRQIDAATAGGLANGEWAKTLHWACDEGGKSYVGTVSWRGPASIERKPLRERLPDLPPVSDPEIAATIAAAKGAPPPRDPELDFQPVGPAKRGSVPMVPAPGAADDSVAMLVKRMDDLCTGAKLHYDAVRALYTDTMGMEPETLHINIMAVGPMPWRQRWAQQVRYLEAVEVAIGKLLDEMRGV